VGLEVDKVAVGQIFLGELRSPLS